MTSAGVSVHALGSALSTLQPLHDEIRARAHTEGGTIRVTPAEVRRLGSALALLERVERSLQGSDTKVSEPE